MGEQCSETSVATSSSTPHWWELHSSPLPSWSTSNVPWQPRNPSSNSSCEEEISISTSFTNASNHSGLSDDSPRDLAEPTSAATADNFPGEPASENHLWSQVLLGIGTSKDPRSGQDDSDNFLAALTSKTLTTETMFEPACSDNYLKKPDNMSWEFSSSPSFHGNMDQKHLNCSYEQESSPNLTTHMVNWSIAPPDPHISLNSSGTGRYNPEPGLILPLVKQEQQNPSIYSGNINGSFASSTAPISSYLQCNYAHDQVLKGENRHHDLMGVNVPLTSSSFTRPTSGVRHGYYHGSSASNTGENMIRTKQYYGLSDVPAWSQTRHFADLISFGGCFNKQLTDHVQIMTPSKLSLKGSIPLEISKKQGPEVSMNKGNNGRGSGNHQTEGKKKRSEDNSETLFKKPKNEAGSTAPSPKVQAPKVKLGDRITALQQIVSPFGKTDTASVLLEAIGYIKFLQEQVQLLSDPYLKTGANKDYTSWGALERDRNSEAVLDLRSRGLCLVPTSCTPQIYRENTGPDYWTPTYRGCLYR